MRVGPAASTTASVKYQVPKGRKLQKADVPMRLKVVSRIVLSCRL